MKAKIISFSLLTFAVLASGSSAWAEDGKTYPGSKCVPYTSASGDIIERFGQHVRNTSNSNSALVTCPAIKDNVASGSGTEYVRVTFSKVDSNGLFCAFYAHSINGSSVQSSSEWDFGGAGTRNMVLDDVTSYNAGTYSFYCILPPGATLRSYRVDEF